MIIHLMLILVCFLIIEAQKSSKRRQIIGPILLLLH